MSPLFSIIIPTRNRSELLKEAINSVLGQLYDDWELIVVDDGSTDNTRSVVFSFQDARIIYFYQNWSERSTARNLGISKSTGEYTLFLDDDDYLLSNHLSVFKDALDSSKSLFIYRTGYFKEDHMTRTRTKTTNYSPKKHSHPVKYAAFNFCSSCTLCIPREYLSYDQFPVEFPYWQDTHLILRLFAKYPLKQLDTYTYVYRIHPEMGSQNDTSGKSLVKKAKLNTAAIKDLFEHHKELLQNHLPSNTCDFLTSEKWLQYSIRALSINDVENAHYFKSKVTNLYFRLLPYYFTFVYKRLSLHLKHSS